MVILLRPVYKLSIIIITVHEQFPTSFKITYTAIITTLYIRDRKLH